MIETPSPTITCCTFRCGGLWFGVDVRQVQEVVRSLPLTPVPLSPPHIRGLANIRGQIITAITLRERLGLPEAASDGEPLNVVVESGESAVSLVVDAIKEVVVVDRAALEPAPDTLRGKVREHLVGVAKLEAGLLLLIDIDSVLADESQ